MELYSTFFPATPRLRPAFWAIGTSLLLGCGGGSKDTLTEGIGPTDGHSAPFIRIESPGSGDTVNGSVPVELDYSLPDNVADIQFGVDDEIVSLRSLFTGLDLLTLSYPDGEHTLTARFVDDEQNSWEDTVTVAFDNPEQRLESNEFDQSKYRAGEPIELRLKYSQPVALQLDFSALDAAFAPGSVALETLAPGEYLARYTLSGDGTAPDGDHAVVAIATAPNGEQTRDELPVKLQTTPDLPIEVAGAVFVPGAAPQADGADPDLRISEFSGDFNILTGGSTQLKLAWAQNPASPVTRVQLSATGFDGYYTLPIEPQPGAAGEVTLDVQLPELKPGFDGGDMELKPGVSSAAGASASSSGKASAIPVAGGGIQISLEWGTDADIDLSVIDPANHLLDFETPGVDGGVLDLDSNALCMPGVRKENIAWKPGSELQGSYQVRVNLFDACSTGASTWKITAQYCGKVDTFTGTFNPGDVDMTGTGRLAGTLMVNCDHVVQGSVSYAKLGSSSPRSKATATTFVSVPAAPIRAVTEATPPVTLAQGVTSRDGKYKLQFSNATNSDWHVEVDSSWLDPGTNSVRVNVAAPGSADPYRFKSPVIKAATTGAITQDLKIRVADQSGAFNLREVLRRGYEWVKTTGSAADASALAPLPVEWKSGVTPPGGTSYHSAGRLYILSSATDNDEFDDPVIAHEFMHYVSSKIGKPGPGGSHSGAVAPDLAWAEGQATAFGLDIVGGNIFRDESKASVMTVDIETLAASQTGTVGNMRTGKLREWLVAALVHDLLDGKNEPHDKMQDRNGSFWAAFDNMAGSGFVDRDHNGPDLVDFIDGYSSRTRGGQDGALKCLTDALSFPYDFAPGTACPP